MWKGFHQGYLTGVQIANAIFIIVKAALPNCNKYGRNSLCMVLYQNIRGFHLSSNMATIGFVNRVTVSIYHDTLYNNVVLQVICEHLYFTHMRKAHDLTN
jgi:hypothetical protein